MSLCNCPERPRCQMYGGNCGNYADWIEMQPASWFERPVRLKSVFTCKACWESYCEWWHKPIKGITRPDYADDDWKPSLIECVRWGFIMEADRERREYEQRMRQGLDKLDAMDQPMILQKGAQYTPEQLKQLTFLARMKREGKPSHVQSATS